ncbi:hypothetical protein GCM10010106_13260 [Thermopolyspora flexuosa]|jgi:hypothetical protein|uniref:Uncharacterized protein n=1 Tax=Thermopolyspora flexuosa TaxID=103836 RepID=A0A543IQ46_9ACTN|nr:hypothetical protein [Thermopolyspora flexuosa]TQM72702.1 hypothetical protein FHX40_4855 [Thermopolyspora flexuosa]GGM68552.1 hypothetical protein GCM10010106_13260 [Thermopolyspora flexuosa]
MAMPRNIRLLWRVWGTVLTAVTVGVVALTAWAQIAEYRHGTYERVQPGVYGAELLSAESRESTTVVYRIGTPVVIVEADGPVKVNVSRGERERLTVRRELAWGARGREFHQEWEGGKVLRITYSCPAPFAGSPDLCSADYHLTVPPDVRVVVANGTATRDCPLTRAVTVCRTADGGVPAA